MKLFSAAQIREWDQYTIMHEPVSSIDLMERAAQKCTDWLTHIEIDQQPIKIFCGKGNNGGDGLAIARQLAEQGILSRIYIIEFGSAGTNEFRENLHRLHQYTHYIHYIQEEAFFPVIKKEDVVIDALFGSGLNRRLEGLSAALVEHINNSGALVVSIDVPSGMFVDHSSKGNPVIKANHTLTFQIPKLGFLLPENEELVGELHVFGIGLHKQFVTENDSTYQYVDLPLIQSLYKPRKKFSHKGTFGHALIAAGSKGKMGAAHLCTKACLRGGAGLVSCLIPEAGLNIMQTGLPEAMCITTQELNTIEWKAYNATGIGPGLGTGSEAVELFKTIIENTKKPMVIDADGLNILSQHPELLLSIPRGSILTPHPKEYERLFGTSDNDFKRLENALENADKLQSYILIKGHHSFIACPGNKGYFNSTGNPGMATGGSGDVLTGILTGLLAQGYTAEEAIVFGVYLHGRAGDIASTKLSEEAMIAGDIIEFLGQAFRSVAKTTEP